VTALDAPVAQPAALLLHDYRLFRRLGDTPRMAAAKVRDNAARSLANSAVDTTEIDAWFAEMYRGARALVEAVQERAGGRSAWAVKSASERFWSFGARAAKR
jgi:hypothetical protein